MIRKILKSLLFCSLILSCAPVVTNDGLLSHSAPKKEKEEITGEIRDKRIRLSLELFKIAHEKDLLVLFYFYDTESDVSKKMTDVVRSKRVVNALKGKYIVVHVNIDNNRELLDMTLKSKDTPNTLIIYPGIPMRFREEPGYFDVDSYLSIVNRPFED